MVSGDIEIELKLPLLNREGLLSFLKTNAKLSTEGISQKDSYFNPPNRDFLGFDYPFEWLRLRETEKGAFLDYKHFHPENVKVTDYCDEFRTGITDVPQFLKILDSLGFKKIIIVDKKRDIWKYKDVKICLDIVEELGNFIELEAEGSFQNPKDGKEYLRSILNEINVKFGEECNRGYPYLLLDKKGYKFGE